MQQVRIYYYNYRTNTQSLLRILLIYVTILLYIVYQEVSLKHIIFDARELVSNIRRALMEDIFYNVGQLY